MIDMAPFPSLVPDFDYGGYYQDELMPWLKSQGLWDRWREAATGSTACILQDRIVVYKVDLDYFLAGKRLPD